MAPGFCAAIRRVANSREQLKVPFSTMSVTARQPFGLSSCAATGKLPAALLTSTLTGPSSRSTWSNAAAMASGSRTSIATPIASAPTSCTAAIPAARCSWPRLATAIAAPSRANSIAIALPKPVPAPVIRTTSPAKVPAGNIAVPNAGGSATATRRDIPAAASRRQHGFPGLTLFLALRYTRAPEEVRDGRRLLRCGNRGARRAGRGGELESPRPAQRLEHRNGLGPLSPDGDARRKFGSAGRRPQGQRAGLLLRGRPEARRQRAYRRAFSGGEGDGLLSPLSRDRKSV